MLEEWEDIPEFIWRDEMPKIYIGLEARRTALALLLYDGTQITVPEVLEIFVNSEWTW